MYESYWDKERKQDRTRNIESYGYVDELVSEEMPDPIAYYEEVVRQKEQERKRFLHDETRPRAFTQCFEKNIGYFLLHSLVEELGVKEVIDLLASICQFQFSIYDMMVQLIYARVLAPCSKSKSVSEVFPLLYRHALLSEDQVYDSLFFIGSFYNKYIELFHHQYEKFYKRDSSRVYFDCTNYYFEIDLPKEDRQKGVSKEGRKEPIIGQALLLDADLVPLGMQMFPGNESEKPYIRKTIEEMKHRYKVNGRTVQVADKGLNCARNIYAAVKEADDGYIFAKSVRGRNLSKKEKEWVLLENSANVFTDAKDDKGNIRVRLMSCVDDFSYSFKEADPYTGEVKVVNFRVKEKRTVSYNPSLAKKQQEEIRRMVDKAANWFSYKNIAKEELEEAVKYVSITNKDQDGKKLKPLVEIDEAKVQEDMRLADYNLMVTSEIHMTPEQIY